VQQLSVKGLHTLFSELLGLEALAYFALSFDLLQFYFLLEMVNLSHQLFTLLPLQFQLASQEVEPHSQLARVGHIR
jgi:hypothetical protein